MSHYIELMGALLFLIPLSIQDKKEHRVSAKLVIVFLVLGALQLVVKVGMHEEDIVAAGLSLLPGILLIMISFLTRHELGMGDGLCVLALGMLMGYQVIFAVLCAALLLSGAAGAVGLVFRKVTMKSHMAFLPFVTVALGVVWSFWMIEMV